MLTKVPVNTNAERALLGLQEMLKDGINIHGRAVPDLSCIGCGRETERLVQTVGAHKPDCPWNYMFRCDHCGYQSNLAKYLGSDCVCH